METELGTDTPHYHAALHALGFALEAQQEPEKAAAAAEKALDAARQLYGEDHPEVRGLKERLARMRGEDGK